VRLELDGVIGRLANRKVMVALLIVRSSTLTLTSVTSVAITGAAVNSRLVSRAKVKPTPSILVNFFFIRPFIFPPCLEYPYVSIDKGIKLNVPFLLWRQGFILVSIFELLIALSLFGLILWPHLLSLV